MSGVDTTRSPKGDDPTVNVIALNEAAVRRGDDLRLASDRLVEVQIQHMKELMAVRASYIDKLAEAEAKRIDAIRAVDVNAVAVASERQAAAATVLANQVASSADALRTLVSNTAATIAEQQRQQSSQITDRITAVERSQYEGRGKELVGDPMMAEFIREMKTLRENQSVTKGKGEGFSASWAILIAAVGFLLTLLTIGSILFAVFK